MTVEVITLVREAARTCYKVTRDGYHLADCASVDELARLVDLADLEPLN